MTTLYSKDYKVTNLIKEIVTMALFEQDQAQQAVAAPPPGVQNPNPVPPAPPAPPDAQVQQPPPQAAPVTMTLDSMIERLNVIRGGKSFTDPEIYGMLTGFYKKLTPDQLSSIEQFLGDLSRIVVNVGNSTESQPQTDSPDSSGGAPPIGANPAGAQAPIGANPAAVGAPAPGGATPGGMM